MDAGPGGAPPLPAAAPGAGQPRARRGASSVEVYGFVGWIASAAAFVVYCLWAFLPDAALRAVGVHWYPSRAWALILPSHLLLTVLFVYWAYESLNMMSVPAPTHPATIHDARSKWITQLGLPSACASTERSIPPLVHMPAPLASRVLFGGEAFPEAEAAVFAGARRLAAQEQLRGAERAAS
ncbi:phosphatidylinositol N-acetylglucosaminyltransferase subunit P [Scenedesmus sp. PABB004]|nr:phosphatidylinositol N-acetylglucosaminyltransferase subunit P [Scenedesmus sp. PABB004]